jgi:hypothetical protein
MDAMLVLIGLVVCNVAPLAVGIVAARSYARHRRGSTRDVIFWGSVGGYLGFLALVGLMLIDTVSRPQPEGLAAFSAMLFVTAGGLPGSILPFLLGMGVDQGSVPRPIGLSSMSTWLVISTLCWQFFLIAGIRWLTQLRSRARRSRFVFPVEATATERVGNP